LATDIGKIFEKELEKVFRSLKETHLLGWHRLADTGSAGGAIISAQPSDYLLALPPGSVSPRDNQRLFFVEVKASEKNRLLSKAAMQPAQRGAISFYREMLQLPYLVLFYDVENGEVQVWDGAAVVQEARIDPIFILARFKSVGYAHKLNQDAMRAALIGYFDLPQAAETIRRFSCA